MQFVLAFEFQAAWKFFIFRFFGFLKFDIMKKHFLTLFAAFLAVFVLPIQSAEAGAYKREVNCMASAIFYEAQGESHKGKVAVGHVILNRMRSGLYPTSACGVIHQKGQFQWVHNHRLRKNRIYHHVRHKSIHHLASKIYAQKKSIRKHDVTRGALFFSANGVTPAPRAVKGVKIGRHQFFNLRGFKYKQI